jgi:hypothetical protein
MDTDGCGHGTDRNRILGMLLDDRDSVAKPR